MATFRPPLVIAVKHSLLSCFESTVTKSPTLKNPGSGSRIMRTTEPFSTFCIITSALWSHVSGVSQSAPWYLFQVWWSQWQGNLLSCLGTKSVQLPCLLLNFSRSHNHYVRMCNISQLCALPWLHSNIVQCCNNITFTFISKSKTSDRNDKTPHFLANEILIAVVGVILNPWRASLAAADCISVSNSTNAMSCLPGTSLTSLNPGNWKSNHKNLTPFSKWRSDDNNIHLVEQHAEHHLIGLLWQVGEEENLVGRCIIHVAAASVTSSSSLVKTTSCSCRKATSSSCCCSTCLGFLWLLCLGGQLSWKVGDYKLVLRGPSIPVGRLGLSTKVPFILAMMSESPRAKSRRIGLS